MSQQDCAAHGGLLLAFGAICTPQGDCPHLSACCLSGGQCVTVYWLQCYIDNGTFQGEGSVCTPTLCDPTASVPTLGPHRNWGRIKAIYR